MKVSDVRKKYVDFFAAKDHAVIHSASLLPDNDPTTLFTNSGMQPLLPYFLGEAHPKGKRLVNYQKCFRAEDIEEIGDNRHTTFFEMLGNWSLGDYFKENQLRFVFTFLTKDLGIPAEKIYITVFAGDSEKNIPKDTESAEIWKKIFKEAGIEAETKDMGSMENAAQVGAGNARIFFYGSEKNWWSRAGKPEKMPSGEPGGPDSEVFYFYEATEHDPKYGQLCHPNCDCGRYVEIGNSVFMQYLKEHDGSFSELPNKNVDFGGGLERLTAAANNQPDIFLIDVFEPIIAELQKLSGKEYTNSLYTASFRIIADHMRGATLMITDGALPSNTDAGYIVRRLIRRATLHAEKLGISESWTRKIVSSFASSYELTYPEIHTKEEGIIVVIEKEIEKFKKTIRDGMKRISKLIEKNEPISGNEAFVLFTTYGFPIELTEEITKENAIEIDRKAFDTEMEKHKELSKSAAEGKFKGGLSSTGEMETKFHTATHLLHQALREILGEHVYQKGSNITPERLRFDFSHAEKLTPEEIQRVEEKVNAKINEALPVTKTEMATKDALSQGVIGLFGDKYDDTISVYRIGNPDSGYFSKEICGGPHVKNTSELGRFKIVKEEAVAQGIRRIKAILE